jgi:hypothetical protein
MLDQNWPVCRSIVIKEKSTVGSPFFGALPSDCIPGATKVVNVHFFMNNSNSCELHKQIRASYNSEIRELLESTTWIYTNGRDMKQCSKETEKYTKFGLNMSRKWIIDELYACSWWTHLLKLVLERFIHLVACLTTGPKTLPKRALHILRSRASSFRCICFFP